MQGKNRKMPIKCKNKHFEEKNPFLSHVPKITQPKN